MTEVTVQVSLKISNAQLRAFAFAKTTVQAFCATRKMDELSVRKLNLRASETAKPNGPARVAMEQKYTVRAAGFDKNTSDGDPRGLLLESPLRGSVSEGQLP